MRFVPNTDNQHFNDWYREFHLLFEDSHGDEQEVMELAKACYDKAQAPIVDWFGV
jgi:hypothetical protein